ncbi:MAG: hypothetical protein WEA29_04750 [Acidimicrobiia bacterium]
MGRPRPDTERPLERALGFSRCPSCTYDFATGEGWRACNYYGCPYLPEALDVFCPICVYNFYTGDGNPGCSDPPDCDFAREEAPRRVAAVARWQARQGA